MNTSRRNIAELIHSTAAALEQIGMNARMVGLLAQLAQEAEWPCVIAVVGRMSRGKSQLLNAWFEQDLAKVGANETTSTLNRFVHGTPNDPQKPVRCKWLETGTVTEETIEFAHTLQGNSSKQVELASQIEYLDFLLPNAALQDAMLVDTPGRGSAVASHSQQADSIVKSPARLEQQSNAITRRAEAILYLMQQTTRDDDRAVLAEFNRRITGHGQVINAVAVVSMIDKHPEWLDLQKRPLKTERVFNELKGLVTAVVPVSAGLYRATCRLTATDRLGELFEQVRTIPEDMLKDMLTSKPMFENPMFECGLSVEDRKAMQEDMEWQVFAVLAAVLADRSLSVEGVRNRAVELSGFMELKSCLETRFFRWYDFLRAHRILTDAREILRTIRREHVPELQSQCRERKELLDEVSNILIGAASDRAPTLIQRLREVVPTSESLSGTVDELSSQIDEAFVVVDQRHDEVAALQIVDDFARTMHEENAILSEEEVEELRALFGLRDHSTSLPKADYLKQRAIYWADVADPELTSEDRLRFVAETAAERYRIRLAQLQETDGD